MTATTPDSLLCKSIESLRFQCSYTQALPEDPSSDPSPRQVDLASYSRIMPEPAPNPRLIAYSSVLLGELGLAPEAAWHPSFLQVFSGQRILPGMEPHACRYGGHQFGHWAGQLGDGRVVNLGECIPPSGPPQMLQLKGAGRTPYSRFADGKAVLRSSLREFLCSEAMHHLGIPTTRALSLVTTGEEVIRDLLYDGHPRSEPGAIVCRVAPSFLRFGHFEIHAARGEEDSLRQLARYALNLSAGKPIDSPTPSDYATWFEGVCSRTAELMIAWQRVGFVHGVMNTDNMSVLGLTIDYGPYGWLEAYDPAWTPNTTDAAGRRYRFGNQPDVALWNLSCLAGALLSLVGDKAPLLEALETFTRTFKGGWQRTVLEKIGLSHCSPETQALVDDLFSLLEAAEMDMTLFFRLLMASTHERDLQSPCPESADLASISYRQEPFDESMRARWRAWFSAYHGMRMAESASPEAAMTRMQNANPKFILRNYLVQEAIEDAEAGDLGRIRRLYERLQSPYADHPDDGRWCQKRPPWADHKPGCSMLSCSS